MEMRGERRKKGGLGKGGRRVGGRKSRERAATNGVLRWALTAPVDGFYFELLAYLRRRRLPTAATTPTAMTTTCNPVISILFSPGGA